MSETITPSSTLGVVEGVQLRARAGASLAPDRFWRLARLVMDAMLIGAATAVADLASPLGGADFGGVEWPLAFGVFVVALSLARGVYSHRVRLDVLDDLRGALVDVAIAMMGVVTLRVLLEDAPRTAADQTLRLAVFAAVYIAAGRVCLDLAQAQARRAGEAVVPTLIIGAGRIGRTTAKRLLEHPELGLVPIGFLDKEPRVDVRNGARLPVLGASWDFDEVVAEKCIGQVIITFSTAPNEVLLRIVKRCEELGIGVSLVPRLFEKVTDRLTIEHLGGLPLLTAHPSNPKGWHFAVKYTLDRVVGLFILLLLAPLLLGVAVAVRISLGRPILFRQLRVGRDGHTFEMLKFRSMRPADPRVDEAATLPDTSLPAGSRAATAARASVPSCARPRSTSCPSSSTCCAATCRSWGRGQSGRSSSSSSRLASTATASGCGSSPESPVGPRCTGCAATPPSRTGSSGTTTTSRTGRSGST